LGSFRAYFLEPVVLYVLLWHQLRSRDAVQWVFIGLGTAALVAGLVALLQYVQLVPSLAPWDTESPRRVVGIFAYPNALGLFVSPIAAMFLAILLFRGFSRRVRIFAGTVLAACVLGIACAVSRGAVLAVGASFLTLALFHIYRRWLVLGVLALLLVAMLVPSTRSVIVSVATGNDVSTDVRSVLWQGTVRLLQDRPLSGAGLGGFPIVYNEYRLAKHTELLLYPHTILFNVWTELGLAGVLVMLWLLGAVLLRAVRFVRTVQEPFARTVTLGALAALIGMVAYGLVDVPYFKNDLAMMFWLLIALIMTAPFFVPAKTNAPDP
jgi:putative inorganic carbon (HCO3(-)) transporter